MRRWLVQSRSLTPAEQDYCRTTALLDSEKSNPRRNHKTPHPPTGNTTAQSHTPNRKKGNNNYSITLPPPTTTHSAKISNKRASGSRNKDTPPVILQKTQLSPRSKTPHTTTQRTTHHPDARRDKRHQHRCDCGLDSEVGTSPIDCEQLIPGKTIPTARAHIAAR